MKAWITNEYYSKEEAHRIFIINIFFIYLFGILLFGSQLLSSHIYCCNTTSHDNVKVSTFIAHNSIHSEIKTQSIWNLKEKNVCECFVCQFGENIARKSIETCARKGNISASSALIILWTIFGWIKCKHVINHRSCRNQLQMACVCSMMLQCYWSARIHIWHWILLVVST